MFNRGSNIPASFTGGTIDIDVDVDIYIYNSDDPKAAGGLVGCVLSGLLGKHLEGPTTYLFLFLRCIFCHFSSFFLHIFHSALGHAVPTLVFPWHSSVTTMCVNAFIYGMLCGSFHATSNVLLLQIWRGRECSPYM